MKRINIYGAGLYGLTLGRVLQDNGFQVKIFEKEDHIGGMLHTHRREGIEVHEHGAHLFHTDDDRVIEFVYKYAEWIPYKHEVKSKINILGVEKFISLPLSYQTITDLYDLPSNNAELCEYMLSATSRKRHPDKKIDDLISRIGWDAFEYLIKPYSEKQWGCEFSRINPEVIERIGMTKDFNKYYFKDKFQALPRGGYDEFLRRLASGLDIDLNCTEFVYDPNAITVFTGPIDELVGKDILPYRSLLWKTYCSDELVAGYPVINTPQHPTSTRFIVHNNFVNNPFSAKTIVSEEYPMNWVPGLNRYYPVNNSETQKIYDEALKELKSKYNNLIMGGRLGLYKYLDMDDTILEALKLGDRICQLK